MVTASTIYVSDLGMQPDKLSVTPQIGELLYRVLITPGQQTNLAYGKDMRLQLGMELTAILVLEDRKIIEWLLE